jgi:hypothetical protein
MSQTRTTADEVLKEFYLPGMRNTLNSTVFLLSQIETNSEDIEGRRAVLAVNTGRNQGIGARAESGTLPTAGRQSYSEQRISLKYNYGRIQISGPLIRSMGSDRGSFTRAVTSETDGVVRDLRNDVNRQLYSDGTGMICTLAAAAAGNTATLQSATATQLRQLQVGMYIDIGTAANPTATASNRQITSINTTAGTFVFDGAAVAITVNDRVTRTGSGGTGSDQKELTGLRAQVDSANSLWNIDPASVPAWVSYVDDNGGVNRAVAENLFIRAQNEVNIASGEDIDLWITSDGVHRGVAALLTSLKRFPTTNELKGGYTGLDMSSVGQGNSGGKTVSMVWEKDCDANTAYGLSTRKFQWYRMSDWEFMEEDGAVLNRVPNTDAYEATLFVYAEMATDARHAHAKIEDLTES